MRARDAIAAFTDALIAEGTLVLGTQAKGSVSVDVQAFYKFSTSCKLLIMQLGAFSEPWAHVLGAEGFAHTALNVEGMIGALKSIRENVAGGRLASFEDIVFAEAFSDLIEQADYLFGQGFILASGVILRAVLEERLSRMCILHSCVPSKPRPTIADYNTELYKRKVYDKITLKHVEAMAAVGNDAAHNKPDLDKSDVERFKRELVSFLQKFAS